MSQLVGLIFWFVPGIVLGQPLIDAQASGLALMPFPAIVAIAILRDQPFDSDVIIRRTLIYSTLTILLGLFYFAAVIGLQQIFKGITGQESDLALIVSTLSAAACKIQSIIASTGASATPKKYSNDSPPPSAKSSWKS